jgi:hypothetical protein
MPLGQCTGSLRRSAGTSYQSCLRADLPLGPINASAPISSSVSCKYIDTHGGSATVISGVHPFVFLVEVCGSVHSRQSFVGGIEANVR